MNVRIFFSSPGDVTMERETAKRIVDRLQSEIGGVASLQPYFWEHEVMVATKDYQENIPQMDDFDIVVCILWSRLGTPLDPERHPKPGGGGFKSGTEYEFFTAMQAHELRGTPDIFVFRNTTEPRRPSRPKEIREKVDREIDRLDDFFDTYFQEDQFFTRAINIYSTLGEFEEKLTIALRSYLTGRLPAAAAEGETKFRPKYDRQPYLGLSAFEYEDAPVFFGRTAEVGEIIAAYQAQEMEANGSTDSPPRHFALILGSSGSGKSSLARAGVLPMLTNPGVIEGANAWRTAVFKPADVPGDPILSLVQSLANDRGLPELFADGTKPKEIADLIRTQPQGGGLLLRQALTQAGAQALTKQRHEMQKRLDLLVAESRPEDAEVLREKIANLTTPSVRIALLADQLEELFTSDLSPDTLATFVGILVALANSGRVFVLATLRSDFYPRCLEHPDLVALMQGSGTYALPAPTAADIGQMIRQPAAIAGLSFEENTSTGEKLDELLRDAALKDPAALPLLSYTLEQLHEQRTDRGLLTLRAYKELGGLEGAIGSRAETVFSSLPGEAQGAFGGLCKQLVTLQEGGEPTRRRAFYTTLTRTPESKTLLDALVNARLLTADQSPSGERIISVAHEALLRHWPRLVSWVEENRIFLNTRTRVASRLADWVEKGKTDEYLIPRGPNLSAAESILAGHLASLDPLEIEFIGRSAERVRREDQRKLRNARLITAGAVVLCLIAVAGGIFAMAAKRQAQQQEKLAQDAAAKAIAAETKIAYTKGIQLLEAGKDREGITALAQTLAIDPAHPGALARLYSEQLYSMPRPLPIHSATASAKVSQRLAGALHGPRQVAVHLTAQDKPAAFDINSRKILPGPWDEEPDSISPMISYDSNHLLNIREDMSLHIWDTRSGKKGAVNRLDPNFSSVWVTIDGEFYAESHASGRIRVASTLTGEEIRTWQIKGEPISVFATGSSYFYSLSATEMRVYDVANKKLLPAIHPPEGYAFVDGVPALPKEADEDAHRCVIRMVYKDYFPILHSLRFFDAASEGFDEKARTINQPYIHRYMPNADATSVAIAPYKRNAIIMSAYEGNPDIVFPGTISSPLLSLSPDGQLLGTSSTDGTVDVFDASNGQRLFSPANHEAQVNELSFTADGRHMLTATNRTATIWELSTASALTMRVPFSGNHDISHLHGDILRVKTPKGVSRIDISKMTPATPDTPMPEGVQGTFANATIENAAAYVDQGIVRFFDISGAAAVEKGTWQSPENGVSSWALSPDGSLFASLHGGVLHLVRTADTSTIASLKIEATKVTDLQFSPDNRHLVGLFPSPEGSGALPPLHIWDTSSLGSVNKDIPERFYTAISISPDGRWLSAAANGKRFNPDTDFLLFDLHDPGKPPRTYPHTDSIASMKFNGDSSVLGVSGFGGTLRVWNLGSMDYQDAPLAGGANQIDDFKFSEDFNLIATRSVTEGKSSVRIWDWREAAPLSAPWLFESTVKDIHFSKDGLKLIAIAESPDENDTQEHFVHVREIIPATGMSASIFPLAQATVAKTIHASAPPKPASPGTLWQSIPDNMKNSWLLKPPVARSVSPSIDIPTTRWMGLDGLTTGEMTRAMPRVPVSHAKMAGWRQNAINGLSIQADETPEENSARMRRMDALRKATKANVDFAGRNTENDPETCYWLAKYEHSASRNYRATELLGKALLADPTNENALELSASISTAEGRHAEALRFLETLLTLDPDNINHRAMHALSLVESGEDSRGREELGKIVDHPALEPRSRAFALTILGRHADALPVYKELAEPYRNGSSHAINGLIYLITAHHYAGDTESAVRHYVELIQAERGAATLSVIQAVPLAKHILQALSETLPASLEKHPELAPGDSE